MLPSARSLQATFFFSVTFWLRPLNPTKNRHTLRATHLLHAHNCCATLVYEVCQRLQVAPNMESRQRKKCAIFMTVYFFFPLSALRRLLFFHAFFHLLVQSPFRDSLSFFYSLFFCFYFVFYSSLLLFPFPNGPVNAVSYPMSAGSKISACSLLLFLPLFILPSGYPRRRHLNNSRQAARVRNELIAGDQHTWKMARWAKTQSLCY